MPDHVYPKPIRAKLDEILKDDKATLAVRTNTWMMRPSNKFMSNKRYHTFLLLAFTHSCWFPLEKSFERNKGISLSQPLRIDPRVVSIQNGLGDWLAIAILESLGKLAILKI